MIGGITAGMAAAISAGVSLTHRAHAHGVAFVTAHTAAGEGPDWTSLVRSRLTLVIYMGVACCNELERALLEAGMAADMPVVIVQSASRADERRFASRLSTLAADVRANGVASPAVFIVGTAARQAAGRTLAILDAQALQASS